MIRLINITTYRVKGSLHGKKLVYHGSYMEIKQPEIIKGRNTKDFGTDFYCTVIKEQSEHWAWRYNTPVVNINSLLIDGDLGTLEFKEMTDEWLDFTFLLTGTSERFIKD